MRMLRPARTRFYASLPLLRALPMIVTVTPHLIACWPGAQSAQAPAGREIQFTFTFSDADTRVKIPLSTWLQLFRSGHFLTASIYELKHELATYQCSQHAHHLHDPISQGTCR